MWLAVRYDVDYFTGFRASDMGKLIDSHIVLGCTDCSVQVNCCLFSRRQGSMFAISQFKRKEAPE